VAQKNSLVVQAAPLSPGKLGTNGYVQNGTAIQYSIVTIDTTQVSGSLLLNVMVHELGNDYSLGDCTGCSNTVMAYPVTSSSPIYPTGCDDITYIPTLGARKEPITLARLPLPIVQGGRRHAATAFGHALQ